MLESNASLPGMESAVEHAIAAGDTMPFALQPICPLAAVPGPYRWYEVLARPCGSPVAAFILTAERIGRIDRIDLMIAHAALHRVRRDVQLSLNVSAVSISDRAFAQAYAAVIRLSGYPRHQLVVEITETADITDVAAAIRFCEEMRRLGIRIALDDYDGHRPALPPECAAIVKLHHRDLNQAMSLKHGDVSLVAEGVENETTLRDLLRAGVDYLQGHVRGGGARAWPFEVLPERVYPDACNESNRNAMQENPR